jgi:hypothetical protein
LRDFFNTHAWFQQLKNRAIILPRCYGRIFVMSRALVLALVFLTSTPFAFTSDELCPTTASSLPFRVAYAHHFMESGVNVLSLRVSIEKQHGKARDVLCRVGTAVAVKYRNEQSWQLLVFSDYEIAKNYEAPDSEQNEPPAYIGACMGIRAAGKARVKCGRW